MTDLYMLGFLQANCLLASIIFFILYIVVTEKYQSAYTMYLAAS